MAERGQGSAVAGDPIAGSSVFPLGSRVNGVTGPESPVGKVVDETVGAVGKTVGGLLGGNR